MPTDLELLAQRYQDFGKLTNYEAANKLASQHNLNPDSVRSRLSRAMRNPVVQSALLSQLRELDQVVPPSVLQQLDIIAKSNSLFQSTQFDENRVGLFVSDVHMPRQRVDAIDLVLQIANDIRPHAITALNDAMDNDGFGSFDDVSPTYQKVWRGDFEHARRLQLAYYQALSNTLADDGQLLGLMGNHDNWIFKHLRSNVPQMAESIIADYMQELFDAGVLQFTRGVHENTIRLSKGLVWVHGLSTASLPTTLARKAFAYFMVDGVASSVVQGHTHRACVVDGNTLGYNGCTFVNSGHLTHSGVDYLKHHPNAWSMGITACSYNPTKWEHAVHYIPFVEQGDMLIAEYKGRVYETKLDKSLPKYLQ